jgi:hypothetical protein
MRKMGMKAMRTRTPKRQWIGLRENLQETTPYFMGKSMVSG